MGIPANNGDEIHPTTLKPDVSDINSPILGWGQVKSQQSPSPSYGTGRTCG